MRIVIVGAGYGGLTLARKLDDRLDAAAGHQVLLLDGCPYHQLVVRLHEVAAATIPEEDAVVPMAHLLRGRRILFRQARVVGLDLPAGAVLTPDGPIPYDFLVLAPGGDTEYHGLPGVREHSFPLKNLADALRLRRHVEGQVVRARRETDPERRAARLTFLFGGGGYTGVELAAELAGRLRDLLALHEVDDQARVILLEARDRLMPGFPPEFSARSVEMLANLGIEVRLETPIASAEAGRVILASGEAIAAQTFVWAGGVRARPLVAESGAPTGAGGRARVDAYLRWEGHENVFVIGDSALVLDPATGEPLPPSAQLAMQQAGVVASNLYRRLSGRPMQPFAPLPESEVVSFGRRSALAMVAGHVFDGTAARTLKDLTYWRYLLRAGALPLPARTPVPPCA